MTAPARNDDRRFDVETPGGTKADTDCLAEIDPDSLSVIKAAMPEPSLAGAEPGTSLQFLRQGYDLRDSRAESLVFNRVVGLRHFWANKNNKEGFARPHGPARRDGPTIWQCASFPFSSSRSVS